MNAINLSMQTFSSELYLRVFWMNSHIQELFFQCDELNGGPFSVYFGMYRLLSKTVLAT
jgi:hypothetical protein